MKWIFSILPLLFISCETDTDSSKKHEILQAIDDGNFQKALNELNGCEVESYFTSEECQINRGMTYFGLAGYDIVSIGEELYRAYVDDTLSEDERDTEIMTIVFEKLKDPNALLGVQEFKKALGSAGYSEDICIYNIFLSLPTLMQQSCSAINPTLLLESLDTDVYITNNYSVDLENLISLEESIQGVVPTIETRDLVEMLNGDEVSEENKNELDASTCLISPNVCSSLGFSEPSCFEEKYKELEICLLQKGDFQTLRLRDSIGSLVLVEDSYITHYDTVCYTPDYLNGTCFPKPVDGEQTLLTEVVDKLNEDDSYLNSIAIFSDVDDTENSEEKVEEFKSDICGYKDCEVTEDNLIDYLNWSI
jgi:hypothetical protein